MDYWATFDCYGTLIDWADGMSRALEPLAGERTPALLGSYYRLEPAVAARKPHLPYRQVLRETLALAAAEQLLPIRGPDVLAESWSDLLPFGDARRQLEGLREAGWKIGILTNCDRDLFALSRERLGVDVDLAITAEDVDAYKPELAHFHEFVRRTGAGSTSWVHLGNSWPADMVSALRVGAASVWIDRDRSGYDPAVATRHQHDLHDLPSVVSAALGDAPASRRPRTTDRISG